MLHFMRVCLIVYNYYLFIIQEWYIIDIWGILDIVKLISHFVGLGAILSIVNSLSLSNTLLWALLPLTNGDSII